MKNRARGLLCGIIMVAATLVGCLPKVSSKFIETDGTLVRDLMPMCQRLNQIGNLSTILKTIDERFETLNRLLDEANPDLKRVEGLAIELQALAEHLLQLLDPEFSNPIYMQTLIWDLNIKTLGLENQRTPTSIRRMRVEKAFTWQGRLKELREVVSLAQNKAGVAVKFQRKASLIELCQLQKSINLIAKVDLFVAGQPVVYGYRLISKNLGEI